jgi:hypothetical protein
LFEIVFKCAVECVIFGIMGQKVARRGSALATIGGMKKKSDVIKRRIAESMSLSIFQIW